MMNSTLNYSLTNQTRSSVQLDVPFYTIILSIVMYSLIFLIGFFGNSLVIIVAYLNRTQQHNTHYCLVNLSIADLLLIIVCMPSAILDLFSKEVWYLGKFFCKIIPWLEHTVAHASILTIVSISIERSLAIALPLKAKRFFTNERLWMVVVFIWVISTLSSIPIMIATTFRQAYHRHLGTNVNICVVGTGDKWQLIYLYISLFLFYLLPCFSLFVLYGNIVFIIKNRNKKKSKSNSYPLPQPSDSLIIKKEDCSSNQDLSELVKYKNDAKKMYPFRKNFVKKKEDDRLSVRNSTSSKKSSITSLRLGKKPSIQLPQINQKQIILLLIVMMLLIFVCLLPYRVFSLWMASASKSQLMKLGVVNYYNIITFCRVAFYTNSALNPIFYHIISTKFQTAFKKFFKLSYGTHVVVSRSTMRRVNNDAVSRTNILSHKNSQALNF